MGVFWVLGRVNMGKSPNYGNKIRCPKCRAVYYDLGKKSAPCPKCREKNLIPVGAITEVRLSIKRGRYNDPEQGWTMDFATRSSTGAVYLNCYFDVLSGPHSGKKFTSLIGLSTPKGPWWGNEGRKTLRNILNSAHGISDNDYSPEALRCRSLTTLEEFDGIEFVAEIAQKKGTDGILRNELKRPITRNDPEYLDVQGTSTKGTGDNPVQLKIDDPLFKPIWLAKV